jgi:hypothetical protein
MRSLDCALALLTDRVDPPPPFLNGGDALSTFFMQGSANSIQLLVRNDFQRGPLFPGVTHHHAFNLHAAIRAVTQNPLDAVGVNRVAVLFGGFYSPFPGAFGVMFDRGFVDPSPDDPNVDPNIVGPPREGCAVFLGAIQAMRQDPLQYATQVLFSTTHELGHVFNLQHIEQPKNFLSTSHPTLTHPLSAFHFHGNHIELLRQAPVTPELWPGGSAFGDMGPLANHDSPWRDARKLSSGLQLVLEMSRRSFFYFEPVELDIILRVSRDTNRALKVPNCLDPGYEIFRLWIEDPLGERRLYRPHRLYCPHGGFITVAPGRAFRRDISIFGQSGGFTFRRGGVHRIWAEFALSSRRVITSNPLEIEVRFLKKVTASFERVNRLFESKRGRLLSYHRIDRSRGKAIQVFENYLRSSPNSETKGLVEYALGRAYLDRSSRLKTLSIVGKSDRRAHDLLKSACDNRYLGTHQREISAKILFESRTNPKVPVYARSHPNSKGRFGSRAGATR